MLDHGAAAFDRVAAVDVAHAIEVADCGVMDVIAGDVDQPGALARLAQQLLHHVVVRRGPVPGRAQLPAVDDAPDQVDRVGVVAAEEIEQSVGLTAAGPEVHVGDEQRAKMTRRLQAGHHSRPPPDIALPSIASRFVSQSDDGATPGWWIAGGRPQGTACLSSGCRTCMEDWTSSREKFSAYPGEVDTGSPNKDMRQRTIGEGGDCWRGAGARRPRSRRGSAGAGSASR